MTGSNHTTTYSYADVYSTCGGNAPPSGSTNAYLTQITDPLGHTQKFCYGYDDGQLRGSTDANSQTTTYVYNTPPSGCSFPDKLDRLSTVTYPDGGKTAYCYDDASYNASTSPPSPGITTSKAMTSSTNFTTLIAFDGLGHTVRTAITSDIDCTSGNGDRTDTTYDGLGRVYTVSNPYCVAGESTSGLTTYTYDAHGRTTQVTHPDNSTILTTYTGRATQVQDEGNGNGSQRVTRISQSDALGRLLSVCEVSSSSLIGSAGTPAACGQDITGTGFLTTYQYDTLDNLLQVNQSGIAARTFTYDSLSRLLTAFNPESGSISYAYDANSNLSTKTSPAPNQTGSGTVTTSYQYDALNRLTQKSYSDSTTPTAKFLYDQYGGYTNTIGRLVESAVGSNTYTYNNYDPMGRIAYQYQGIPNAENSSYGYLLLYSYDLMGNMTASGTGRCNCLDYTYTYNSAARLTGLPNVLSAAHYDAAGRLTSDTLGNGETESWTYNKRGWPVSSSSTLNSTTFYSYNITSFAPNGDILAANDSANGNWTYSYDAFNRLVGSNKNSGQAVYSYVYDRFGNRWQQNGPNSMQLSFSGANNRMDGYTYDAAGNLLNDGTHQYFYDAENHLIQVDGTLPYCSSNGASGTAATACYFYDAAGHRVRNTAVPDGYGVSGLAGGAGYTYDLSGRWVATTNTSSQGGGVCCSDEIYAGGRHLVHSAGSVEYMHLDWLGTERVRTSAPYGGTPWTVCESIASLPFGDGQTTTGACYHTSTLHFTGKERDSESGLDNFGARYNASSFGRFMSPDNPKFSEKTDPQTWNLYSYVSNNPLARVDLTGDNWFNINGSWQWYEGADVTNDGKACKHGTRGCNHSDFTHLLVIQKLGEKTDKGATKVKITLYNQNKVIAQSTGFTGSDGDNPLPNGNYQINLNNRGGVDTNVSIAMGGGLYVLRAYHDGIQEVGNAVPAGDGTINWQDEWGSLRANLSRGPGEGTQYYLHGKGLYFTEGHSYTAGCVCDPYQSVLKVIFKLDPSGVGEGDKNGRIAVSVNKPN